MATQLPEFVVQGERARLFPVLAETSKEGRTLSVFLACVENVGEFGRTILADAGLRLGSRSRIETYTEVVLKNEGARGCRPDGLILVNTGQRMWSALVEAKVGNAELSTEQVESYLEVAKLNGVDALITLSNQFAAVPTHHPVPVSAVARRRAELLHWSWMYILTEAGVLLGNDAVADRDQQVILQEMVRFLSHASTGVKGFDQMPAVWSEMVDTIQAGGHLASSAQETLQVVGAWHQKARDLSLILSRQLNREVKTRIARAHISDPSALAKSDAAQLAKDGCLTTTFLIPDAAAPLDIRADVQKRSLSVSMSLKAPEDRKSTKARLNWLLRQIENSDLNGVHIRMHWGRAGFKQYSLASLRGNPDLANGDRSDQTVQAFDIVLVRDLGAKFSQRRNFVAELDDVVPRFYEAVGQHLRAWQAPAPPLPGHRVPVETVSPEAIQIEAETEALGRGKMSETAQVDIMPREAPGAPDDIP